MTGENNGRKFIAGARYTTPQGCRVTSHLVRDKSGLIIEAVTLEHPLELVEVAVGRERVLERAGGRK